MKLHLGCGPLRFPGWINLDIERGHDLRRGLPGWEDGSVQSVYTCHFLEHVTHAEGEALLREVHRVLQPGGVVRIGVPDFELFARAYVEGDQTFSDRYFENYCSETLDALPLPVDEDPRPFRDCGPIAGLLAIVYGWGHRAIYDERLLRRALLRAGFPGGSIHRCAFGQSHYYGRCELDLNYEDHTVFVEAAK